MRHGALWSYNRHDVARGTEGMVDGLALRTNGKTPKDGSDGDTSWASFETRH